MRRSRVEVLRTAARRGRFDAQVPSALVPLDAAAARRVYDRIGLLEDTQGFYEDAPVRRLAELANFQSCTAVFELGCGTGRFAKKLLTKTLPDSATYLGVEVSSKMATLARKRLSPWSPRARVLLVEPPADLIPADDGVFDRVVSMYVFDLLSPLHTEALINEFFRVLAPGGLMSLTSLTHGTTKLSRVVSITWKAVSERWPALVGGCRPIEVLRYLDAIRWEIEHSEVMVRFGVPSEIVIARRNEVIDETFLPPNV